MTNEAIAFVTDDERAYYRFTVTKGRIKMEEKGLKFRDGAIRPKLAKEFGLKPRDPYSAYIAYCETQQALLLAKRTFPTKKEQS